MYDASMPAPLKLVSPSYVRSLGTSDLDRILLSRPPRAGVLSTCAKLPQMHNPATNAVEQKPKLTDAEKRHNKAAHTCAAVIHLISV